MKCIVAFAMCVAGVAAQVCPPDGFDSAAPFNTTKYLGRWYAQEQMEITYLPLEWNYCTATRYELIEPDLVAVFNEARVGSVDGPPQGAELRAFIPDLQDPSKLSVGPIAVPTSLYGPYWVLAVGGGSQDAYGWAVISGGPPTIPSGGACRTRTRTVNNSGLWLFHRVPEAPEEDLAVLRATAASLGFDISVLNPVEHRGCNYTKTEASF
jgi:lipocalin